MAAERSSPTPDPACGSYAVSVRSLCEFSAKQGDLDRRFTPSATALEGLLGETTVAARRGPGYEVQIRLERHIGLLHLRGRADGYDSRAGRLEEVKTVRGTIERVPHNRRQLHWAQLQCYGALFCAQRGLAQIDLALVYFDIDSETETVLQERRSAAELEALLAARCAQFMHWAQQETQHRRQRDAALRTLPFPLEAFRPGQRALSEAVYRAASAGRCLLAQAPTGIGKTLGTLYPMLRAMPLQQLDKLAYLTCKNTGRAVALETLAQLRTRQPQAALRVLTLVAKDQACEHPGKACHGDVCPLAKGFYDRLPAARQAAADAGWLDTDAQRQIALAHGICPYYLGQEMLRWADVVVGDVHHSFDPSGQLHGLAQALDWRVALLVDEGHNLVERARQMYSAELGLTQMRAVLQAAPGVLRPALSRLRAVAEALVPDTDDTPHYTSHEAVPTDWADALGAVNTALGEYLQHEPLTQGPLLDFYFASLRLQRRADQFGPHSLFDLRSDGPDTGATFCVRNVVPGAFLKARFQACHSVTVFSATLGSRRYQQDMLGLPEDTAWIDVPPAFPPEHLQVRVAALSTRYARRQRSLDAVVEVIASQYDAHPGNYLAFFSSFDYLQQAAARCAARWPTLPIWTQSPSMGAAARQSFLQRFEPDGRGIGFAVLGGAFAEGVDLPGSRLVGAFVATLGLPPVSPVQQRVRTQLDTLFGPGHGYADLVPGLQKVVQAAGRVLRSPSDRGWLWLIDERYRQPEVLRHLPAAWGLAAPPGAGAGL